MSWTIEGKESTLATESQGVWVWIPRAQWRAMRRGNGGESLSCRSEAWYMRCETCLDVFLFPVRRGGGVVESLSEVRRRVARLESPRPLEGSLRRLGCVRSIEWSLEESERLALEEAVECVMFIKSSCAPEGGVTFPS